MTKYYIVRKYSNSIGKLGITTKYCIDALHMLQASILTKTEIGYQAYRRNPSTDLSLLFLKNYQSSYWSG